MTEIVRAIGLSVLGTAALAFLLVLPGIRLADRLAGPRHSARRPARPEHRREPGAPDRRRGRPRRHRALLRPPRRDRDGCPRRDEPAGPCPMDSAGGPTDRHPGGRGRAGGARDPVGGLRGGGRMAARRHPPVVLRRARPPACCRGRHSGRGRRVGPPGPVAARLPRLQSRQRGLPGGPRLPAARRCARGVAGSGRPGLLRPPRRRPPPVGGSPAGAGGRRGDRRLDVLSRQVRCVQARGARDRAGPGRPVARRRRHPP